METDQQKNTCIIIHPLNATQWRRVGEFKNTNEANYTCWKEKKKRVAASGTSSQ